MNVRSLSLLKIHNDENFNIDQITPGFALNCPV